MAPYVNGMAGAAAAWKKYDGEVMATFNALPPLTTIPQFVDESFEFVLQAAFVPLTLGGHKAQYANQAARCLFAILSKCKTNINTIKTTLGQSALVQNGTCLVRSFAPRVYRPYLQNEALLAILSGELLVQHKAVTIDLPIAWLACFDNQRCDAASGWLYGYTSECWLTVNLDFPQKGVDLGPNEIRWLVFLYILACYNVYRPDAPGQNATNCMTLQTIYCPDPCDAQFEPLETQVNAPADKIPVSAEGGTFPLVNATGWPYCTLGSQGGWGPWATNGIYTGVACFKDWLTRGCCHVIVPDSGQPQWVGFTTDAPPASRQTYYDRVIRFGLRAPEHFWEWEVPTPSNPFPPPYSGTEAAMALAGGPDEGVDLDAILALAPCYVGGYITPGSCNQPKRVYQGLSLVPCDCDNYYFWKTPQCAWYDPPA